MKKNVWVICLFVVLIVWTAINNARIYTLEKEIESLHEITSAMNAVAFVSSKDDPFIKAAEKMDKAMENPYYVFFWCVVEVQRGRLGCW